MDRKPLILEKWDFILILGESGGGKGTLVENIKRYWLPGLKSASMGDMFRQRALEDPEIRRMTEQGILIDNETACRVFRDYAVENTPGLIDGYPRNRKQAIDLIRFTKENGWRLLVIDLHCRVEKIIERLLARKRPDDNLAIVYKRHTDHKNLHPFVMEEIHSRHDLFDVITLDGNTTADIVFTQFLLGVLRYVDMLYFYDMADISTTFAVHDDETNIDPAINRWLSSFLRNIQNKLTDS